MGLRGSGAFGAHPPGLHPQNMHFECQNAPDLQTKSIHGQCFELGQMIGYICIYKGLKGFWVFGVTLRGCTSKTRILGANMAHIHNPSQSIPT